MIIKKYITLTFNALLQGVTTGSIGVKFPTGPELFLYIIWKGTKGLLAASPMYVNQRSGLHFEAPYSPHIMSRASWPVLGTLTLLHESKVPCKYSFVM